MATTQQFNNYAVEFLNKMIQTFPTETKIQVYLLKFETLKLMNSRKPVEMFMDNMYPFGEQIMSNNEDFFKKDEFVNNAENISGKIGLVDHWDSTDEKTKASIWEYMKGLYVLGMSCLGKEAELQQLLIKINYYK
mgnify:CR=1 FL=1|jgi:hypothetical protein